MLSEQEVEKWLLENPDAAARLFRKQIAEEETVLDTTSVLKSSDVYQSFFEIAKMLNTCLDSKLIIDYVLKTAVSLIKVEKCSIYLYDKHKNDLHADVIESGIIKTSIRVPMGSGIIGTVAKERHAKSISIDSEDPWLTPDLDELNGCQTKSMLVLPILEQRGSTALPELIGVACLINKIAQDDNQGSGKVFQKSKAMIKAQLKLQKANHKTSETISESLDFLSSDHSKTRSETCLLIDDSKTHISSMERIKSEVELAAQEPVLTFNKETSPNSFSAPDVAIFKNLLVLVGIALKNARLYEETHTMVVENKRLYEVAQTEFKKGKLLLELAQKLNAEEDVNSLISSILQLAKQLMNADICSLFLLDKEKNEVYSINKLYSQVFQGKVVEKITIPVGKGVAGSVAESGTAANILDAYADPRFNPAVDKANNYKTTTMLCVPIFGPDHKVLGVANLINKLGPDKEVLPFLKADQELFEAFAVFSGLALHKAVLFEEIKVQQQRLTIVMELMSFHAKTNDQDVENFINVEDFHFQTKDTLASWKYDPHQYVNTDDVLCAITHQFFIFMNYDTTYEIPDFRLVEYILTVRRNYRPVAYHNFTHAVSVTHSLFVLIVNGVLDDYMDQLELFSMLMAALNHDIDHRGTNNAFQAKTGSVLANFYATSTMERHHFNHAMNLLNSTSGINILEKMSNEDYKRCLKWIESAILATDLALFFTNKKKIAKVVAETGYQKDNEDHKNMLCGILMTCSDLGAMYKDFEGAKHTANSVYEEFFQQGDKEKKMGMPFSSELTDRSKMAEIPRMQVGFYNFVVIPAFECLHSILGQPVKNLFDGVQENRDLWKKLQDDGTPYSFEPVAVPSMVRESSALSDNSRSYRGSTTSDRGGLHESTMMRSSKDGSSNDELTIPRSRKGHF